MNASNLNISTKLTTTNISATNISATAITAPNVQPTLTAGTGINISNNVISSIATSFTAGNNISILNDVISLTPNISVTNISATAITAPNVQPTLTAGTGINISNNVISTIETLTAGSNISILNDVVSLTPNINISNLSVINGSFSALTCSGNISFPIGFALYRDFTGLLNVCDIQIRGLFSSTFSATTGNFSKINVSNVSFTGLGPKMSMGGLGEIFGVGTYTGLNCNVSQVNASNISVSALSLTGDMTVGGYFNNKDRFVRRYRVGDQTLSGTSYRVFYGTSQYAKDDLVTEENNDTFTIVKAGRYKISTNIIFSNGTYTDRVNWRVQLFKNDVTNTSLGEAYCYTRYSDYAKFGSAYHSTIEDFDVDDTFYYEVTANKASETGFNSNMVNLLVLRNTFIEMEYLGV
jgi:hypothetical protein